MDSQCAVIRHEHLIRTVVNRYFLWLLNFGYEYEDLLQEGRYAVLLAEPKYDPSRGLESTLYYRAVRHWITNRIVLPMLRKKRGENVRPASLDALVTVDMMTGAAVRLDNMLMDPAPPIDEQVAERQDAHRTVYQALDWLRATHPKQADAVWLRYGHDMSIRDVGRAIGCTHQNAADLALRGLRNLRDYMTDPERSAPINACQNQSA